jgi:zinc protease
VNAARSSGPLDCSRGERYLALGVLFSVFLVSCATTPPPPEQDVLENAKLPPRKAPPPPPPPAAVPVPTRPLATVAPLTVVLQPVKNTPIVSVRVVFHAGAVDDPPGKEGLTSLTTRLMSEGGTKELSSAQLIDALFPMAAELDAGANKEFTVWEGRVHTDKLDRFIKIFTDTLLEPRFDPKEFDRLRTEALNNIKNRLRQENDEGLGQVALDSVLYAGHPYRHFNGGTVAGLNAITLDDVKAHALKVFSQDRCVLGLAGAVDDKLAAKVKGLLGKLPATGAPPLAIPPAPGPRARTLIVQRDTISTGGSFGYSWDLRREDPDYFAVALAMSYLGEHRQLHGRLFSELREKRGLNYGTYAYAEHFQQAGWGSTPQVNVGRSAQDTMVWLRPVEPKNAVFATRGILYFIDEELNKPIPADRFDTARGFLSGVTRLWEQTDQRRLGYAIDELYYGGPKFLERYRTALATMTPEQMQAALKRHLDPARFNFAYVTKDAEGLKAQLASKAPSPITYATPKPDDVLAADKQIEKFPLPMDPRLIQILDANSVMEQ